MVARRRPTVAFAWPPGSARRFDDAMASPAPPLLPFGHSNTMMRSGNPPERLPEAGAMDVVNTMTARDPAYRWGAATLLLACVAILTALGFEYIGGYTPCPLCLQQRYAYYATIPLLFVALILLGLEMRRAAFALFATCALAYFANAALAAYHAGVERKLWPGPDTCSAALAPLASGGALLKELETVHIVRCDEVAWRFGGLSFAGWNVILSVMLGLGATIAGGAARTPR
jgi:disulfide bond formation protein DsbB